MVAINTGYIVKNVYGKKSAEKMLFNQLLAESPSLVLYRLMASVYQSLQFAFD